MIRIPKVFYDDHVECCDLPAPPIAKQTKSHYWIDENHPDLPELLNNAEHYSDCAGIGWDFDGMLGMQSSARATVKAIHNAKG